MPTSASPSDTAWTCPFCPLLCDEFALDTTAAVPVLQGSDCPRALAALEQHARCPSAPGALVDGLSVGVIDAIVKINIFQDVLARPGDSGKTDNIERRIAAHLVMPHAVLIQIYEWLGRQLADRNSYLRRLAEQREKDQREHET